MQETKDRTSTANRRQECFGQEYLHAEIQSRLFGFIDDLEILIDEEQNLIFVQSASRVGFSDLGANRNRVQEIRRRYEAL